MLNRLGFRQFRILLNNRKILTGLGNYVGVPDEQLGGLYRAIDKLEKIGVEGVKEELAANGLSDEAIARLMALLTAQGSNGEMLAGLRTRLQGYPRALAGVAELEEITRALGALGVPESAYQVTFSMVRGLDYYTGPIYETVVDEPRIGSITGGGRYDELIGLFTNQSLPATGTSLGIERIIDVMDELGMFPPQIGRTVVRVLVTRFDQTSLPASLQAATELRRAGLSAELYMEDDALGKQIRYAVRKGIPYLVILGPDEITNDQVTLRHLARGEQETVARAELVAKLQEWVSAGE